MAVNQSMSFICSCRDEGKYVCMAVETKEEGSEMGDLNEVKQLQLKLWEWAR